MRAWNSFHWFVNVRFGRVKRGYFGIVGHWIGNLGKWPSWSRKRQLPGGSRAMHRQLQQSSCLNCTEVSFISCSHWTCSPTSRNVFFSQQHDQSFAQLTFGHWQDMTVKHSVLFYSTQLCYICLIVEYTVIWDMHQKSTQPYFSWRNMVELHAIFIWVSERVFGSTTTSAGAFSLPRIWFDANCRSGGWLGPRRTTMFKMLPAMMTGRPSCHGFFLGAFNRFWAWRFEG